ncbi:MAG TPA: TonB-dependent receptor, partial [Deltaproteobacteria bacterium]|nr:TonB-dependent receptor [Deltaproteobacteria bacterium]
SLELTYFHNLFEDLIDFDSAAQRYKNVGEARSDGWEAALSATPWPALSLRASFTLTRTEDRETGNDLLRRPKHKAGLDANWKVSDTFGIRLDIRHTGARDDEYYDTSTWSSRRVRLDPYTLVNIAWWYEPDRKTRFWVRIDNLLDEDYEEIWGYQTPGIGVSAGVGVTL